MTTATLINPANVAQKQGWLLTHKEFIPGDGTKAPGYVTLCARGNDTYCTHFFNTQSGGFVFGHYFDYNTPGKPSAETLALVDFNNRVRRGY